MRLPRTLLLVVVLSAALAAPAAWANVFSMPAGVASLQFVTVGDPGNAADTNNSLGYGSVPYVYQMGKYDVTIAQYCQFLNAVAAADPYGLYNVGNIVVGPSMAPSDFVPTAGINQNGSSGSYTYSISGSYSQAANCPIFDISWGDAARFCNWLDNGQPTGAEGPGTTETGAYTLNGAMSDAALTAVTRNSGAAYFLPSVNEWYKAAFYNAGTGTYWTYPTQSDSTPSNALSSTGTNNANYDNSGTYTDPTNRLTPVGYFAGSPGPYGTFDMGGDVAQWNEGAIGTTARGYCGGSFADPGSWMQSWMTNQTGDYNWASEGQDLNGFRVAAAASTVPHLPGDANGDGRVDINDLTIVLTNFGMTGAVRSQGEFTGDGTVDVNDLTIVLANFGEGTGSSAGLAAVPEPAALLLSGIGLAGLLACGRRKPGGQPPLPSAADPSNRFQISLDGL
jgi:formylglycine-generating enzyme required for sulfatase activity